MTNTTETNDKTLRSESLSKEELSALRAVGVHFETGFDIHVPCSQTGPSTRRIEERSITIMEAANHLGITEEMLLDKISAGELLVIMDSDGKGHRIPLFQITEGGELPGLSSVLRELRKGIKPIIVEGFFMTPQPDLEAEDGSAMTPVQWLAMGKDTRIVVELAKYL